MRSGLTDGERLFRPGRVFEIKSGATGPMLFFDGEELADGSLTAPDLPDGRYRVVECKPGRLKLEEA